MRTVGPVFALAICLFWAPALQAARPGLGRLGGGERILYGMVESVQAQVLTFSQFKKKAAQVKDRRIRLDGGTKITANGQPANLSALSPGQSVRITLKHGVALEIQITTKN
jgi:hypothetical protein